MKIPLKYIFLCFCLLIYIPKIKSQTKVEAIGSIIANTIPDEKLEYKIEHGKILFSKEETLKLLCAELNKLELKQLTQNDQWFSRSLKNQIADYQMSYDFLNSNRKLILENPWKADSIKHRDYDKLTKIHKTSIELNSIFCHMIDSGNFKLIIKNKEVKKLLKFLETQTDENSYSETEIFMTVDKIKIWNCLIYAVIE